MKNERVVSAPAASRRRVLALLPAAAGLVVVACGREPKLTPVATDEEKPKEKEEEEGDKEALVTPGEDLMQEHGVVERVLLVYDEAARRIVTGESLDLALVGDTARLVRRFVQDYHEKTEEDVVFPRLEKAGRETELCAILRRQHDRGREATDEILRAAEQGSATPQLAELMRAFARMYRPHAAREDTVIFPAFRSTMGDAAYREHGEMFEAREHEALGENGFSETVAEVARIEEALGIGDLDEVTLA